MHFPLAIFLDLDDTILAFTEVADDCWKSLCRRSADALPGVTFETGNISALPFPDDAFDAAFGHTIVMQFRDPVQALTEVYRVVKPGGVVGFREVDFSGNLCEPPHAAWQEFWELFARVLQHNGGNARVGKRLGGLLRLAGFGRIAMSPAYIMTGGTPKQTGGVERGDRPLL